MLVEEAAQYDVVVVVKVFLALTLAPPALAAALPFVVDVLEAVEFDSEMVEDPTETALFWTATEVLLATLPEDSVDEIAVDVLEAMNEELVLVVLLLGTIELDDVERMDDVLETIEEVLEMLVVPVLLVIIELDDVVLATTAEDVDEIVELVVVDGGGV